MVGEREANDDAEDQNNMDEPVIQIKSKSVCVQYLKHVTNRFIASGQDAPLEIANLEL